MSVLDPEQRIAAQKANAATLFALTNQAFEGFQRLIELNMRTARSALAESEAYCRESLSGMTPENLLAWRTNLMQPAAEQALAYNWTLWETLSGIHAEWVRAARRPCEHQSHVTQTSVDNSVNSTSAGPDVRKAALKSALETTSSAGETARQVAERAIETAKGTRTAHR